MSPPHTEPCTFVPSDCHALTESCACHLPNPPLLVDVRLFLVSFLSNLLEMTSVFILTKGSSQVFKRNAHRYRFQAKGNSLNMEAHCQLVPRRRGIKMLIFSATLRVIVSLYTTFPNVAGGKNISVLQFASIRLNIFSYAFWPFALLPWWIACFCFLQLFQGIKYSEVKRCVWYPQEQNQTKLGLLKPLRRAHLSTEWMCFEVPPLAGFQDILFVQYVNH